MKHITENTNRSLRLNDAKVLLVEDDPVTRWMVRMALKDECLLTTAQDAGKALSIYKAYRPDMVLLDIGLPETDGMSVLSQILRIDPGAYIIMFSSLCSLDNIIETAQRGAKGFVTKPFIKQDILNYMNVCPLGN